MKTFLDMPFRHSYRHSRGHDPISEFLVPALGVSRLYQRASGYFSSRVLVQLAPGIAQLVQNGGKMQLITSHAFTPADAAAVEQLVDDWAFQQSLVDAFEKSFTELKTELERHSVRAMLWMLRSGLLEIKVVVPRRRLQGSGGVGAEIYHPKFGIMTDSAGNQVAFAGSLNETVNGWLHNIENMNVFSGQDPTQKLYLDDFIEEFEQYWSGDAGSDWAVLALPDAVAKQVIERAGTEEPNSRTGLEVEAGEVMLTSSLRSYQTQALDAWKKAGRVGLLEMATGTGKTRTARACIDDALLDSPSLLTIVIAPYQHIADQWAKELAGLNTFEITASANWRRDLQQKAAEASMGRYEVLTIVAVKNTAGLPEFSNLVNKISSFFDNTMLVGDEVHWLGAPAFRGALLKKANWRLGLSATPERYFDDEGSQALQDYFRGERSGEATVFRFSLSEALEFDDPQTGQKILAPYRYFPVFVELTPEEQDEYDSWSRSIARYSRGELSPEEEKKLNEYRNARAMVLKKATNKDSAFRDKVNELGKSALDFSLVYCSESKQMERIAALLSEFQVDFSRITSAESAKPSRKLGGRSERETIIHSFAKGRISTLLSIDCLDEGVDIPPARAGFILASSGNPKEFIQRRGRLMRQFPGKERADIYDFVAMPHGTSGDTSFGSELSRMFKFSQDAQNRDEIRAMLKTRFGITGEEDLG